MTGQYSLSIFLVVGCFMSCFLAGVGGLNEPSITADLSKYNERAVKTLTVIIIVGSIAVLLLDIFGMCIGCTYGSYFKVQINQRGRAAFIRFNQEPNETTVIMSQTAPGYNSSGATDVHSLQEQLQEQNCLLREQVRLQQQLLYQQQQQQMLQVGQFGYGMPPQPPWLPGLHHQRLMHHHLATMN